MGKAMGLMASSERGGLQCAYRRTALWVAPLLTFTSNWVGQKGWNTRYLARLAFNRTHGEAGDDIPLQTEEKKNHWYTHKDGEGSKL